MDTDGQQCQVCHRSPESKLAFYCHKCARETVYESRLKLAQQLLSKESLGKEIEALVASKDREQAVTEDKVSKDAANKLSYESARSEYRLIAARTQSILDDSQQLQGEIEKMRKKLAEMKSSIAKRRTSVKAATQEISYAEETSVKAIQDDVSSTKTSWGRLHKRIVSGRHVLPRELVSLYGLQIRKRRRGNSVKDTFSIAGVPVFNLKELNTTSPQHLNASTYHVAHLIHISSHYLGLRLPAEMSLATAGQPYTYIHTPMSSYKSPNLNFGTRDSSVSKSTTRKRVLYIEKPLPQLASEDSQAYSLYLDAIILLAWNVAWVAKAQGIDVGGKGWEDICLVGKNLWDLFGESSAEQDANLGIPQSAQTLAPGDEESKRDPGLSSQASAYSFLNSAGSDGAADYMKAWRYATPTRIIETIKSALMHERMGADWEVLEKPDDEAAAQENNGQISGTGRIAEDTTITMPLEERQTPKSGQESFSNKRETSEGWTKIK